MTIIVLLLAAAVGVAGLLYRWSARLDDAPQGPSLSYPLFSQQQWTDAIEDGSSTQVDDDDAPSAFTLPYSIPSLQSRQSPPSTFGSEDRPARRADDAPARVAPSFSYSLFAPQPSPRVSEDVPPRQTPAAVPVPAPVPAPIPAPAPAAAAAARVPLPLSYSLFPSQPSPSTRVSENGHPRQADAPVPPRISRPVAAEPEQVISPAAVVRPRDEDDDTETIRFVRPSELSVQLLPGRLEVIEGATPHREIRFLRAPGETPHVVLGREVGVSPHYIGLGSPMVSRRHARLDFTDNRWVVKNLSRTNPLVVNDYELTEDTRPLADGDRLQLGDVVLRFHAQ